MESGYLDGNGDGDHFDVRKTILASRNILILADPANIMTTTCTTKVSSSSPNAAAAKPFLLMFSILLVEGKASAAV